MTSDPAVLERERVDLLKLVHPKVIRDYRKAWDRYQSTCVTGGTPEQRETAYEQARVQEDRLHRAVVDVKRRRNQQAAKTAHA